MKKKIIWDSKEPSSEEIQSQKNFNSILERIGVGSPKTKWWSVAAVVTGAIGLGIALLFINSDKNENQDFTEQTEEIIEQKIINNFLIDIELPKEIFEFSSTEKVDIITKEGGIISIPSNSFQNEDGSVYQGQVEFTYATYNDPLSIYLSGISMTYDSSGVDYAFQTGGMFEISAIGEGNNLEMNPENKIEIYHPSTFEEEELNTYFLSDRDSEWEYKSKSEVFTFEEVCEKQKIIFEREITEESVDLNKKIDELADLEIEKHDINGKVLVEPHLYNSENHTFDLDIDPIEFPELSNYQNVTFEVVDPDFKFYYFDKVWEDIRLSNNGDGSYQVVLYEEKDKKSIRVFPVLSKTESDKAIADYKVKLREKEEELAQLKDQIFTLDEYIEEKKSTMIHNMKVRGENSLINFMAISISAQDKMPLRKFTISNLGIFNGDKPFTPPINTFQIDGDFIAGNSGEDVFAVTMVNLNKNVFIELAGSTMNTMQFIRRNDHIAFGKDSNGNLVILNKRQFKDVPKNVSKYEFEMEVVEIEQNDFEKIQEIVAELIEG